MYFSNLKLTQLEMIDIFLLLINLHLAEACRSSKHYFYKALAH